MHSTHRRFFFLLPFFDWEAHACIQLLLLLLFSLFCFILCVCVFFLLFVNDAIAIPYNKKNYKLLNECGDRKHSFALNNFVQRQSMHFDTDTDCCLRLDKCIYNGRTSIYTYGAATFFMLAHSQFWMHVFVFCFIFVPIIFICRSVDLVDRSPMDEISGERTSTEYWNRFLHKLQTNTKRCQHKNFKLEAATFVIDINDPCLGYIDQWSVCSLRNYFSSEKLNFNDRLNMLWPMLVGEYASMQMIPSIFGNEYLWIRDFELK